MWPKSPLTLIMALTSSKKLFQEHSNLEDKSLILSHVYHDGTPIKVRTDEGRELKVGVAEWVPPFRMRIKSRDSSWAASQKFIIQFDNRDERYFARVHLDQSQGHLDFIFAEPLYRLQRRQYQRLQLPLRYKNKVFIMRVNKEVWNEESMMIDLSLGGCSLRTTLRSLEIPTGAFLMLDISVGEGKSFLQMGQVCYKRVERYLGRNIIRMGIRFHAHPKSDFPLHTLVQNLALDLFGKWSKAK